jgi:PadR family transcriptional regulator, regulatory protein PadR
MWQNSKQLIMQIVVILQTKDYVDAMASEMREPTFWVLTVLTGGRRHGYALMEEARELSGGRFNLKVATLYAALERLGQQGWVAQDGDEVVDGRLRRYFRLTDKGAAELEAEVSRLEANAHQARSGLRARRAVSPLAAF